MKEPSFSTPMMHQYMQIKKEYKDCLLFFRLGDFYELFLEDAKIGARVLGITLTARPRGKDGDIPMAGVPYHAAEGYIAKLVGAGYKVAICEQITQPNAKEIVQREVVRIVTPGTLLDESSLRSDEHNYFLVLAPSEKTCGVVVVDIGTGDIHISELSDDPLGTVLRSFLDTYYPVECIVSSDWYSNPIIVERIVKERSINLFPYESWIKDKSRAIDVIMTYLDKGVYSQLQLEGHPQVLEALGNALSYITHTQKGVARHIKKISWHSDNDRMGLDSATMSNLELFEPVRDRSSTHSLVSLMDETMTAMGGRLLRQWIKSPLVSVVEIQSRHDVVDLFLKKPLLRKSVRKILSHLYDLERLVSRISLGYGLPKDIFNIALTVEHIRELFTMLPKSQSSVLSRLIASSSVEAIHLATLITKTISVDHSGSTDYSIAQGVDRELDSFRSQLQKTTQAIVELERHEKEKSGISTLKVRYNKVFGYYIEVSKALSPRVPDYFFRKQTLVNAERFTTQELRELEVVHLVAEEKCLSLEKEHYERLVQAVTKESESLLALAGAVAELDCLVCFAQVAERRTYVRPRITQGRSLEIIRGRHPVVEAALDTHEFVPNDTTIDPDVAPVQILTGPNMAGKSVYMRQVALIILLAQIGSFVPADQAMIGVVDKIFVRSGATDRITEKQSTFMVEMVETAHILRNCTPRSFIILDEIGRGTSTYDGVSIAWAVASHLAQDTATSPKTIFATHYHELQELAHLQTTVLNYQVAVQEHKGKPVFLHTVTKGEASHSYGIAVAQLAGVPEEVLSRAREKLQSFEKRLHEDVVRAVSEELARVDVSSLTPLDSLTILNHFVTLVQHDTPKSPPTKGGSSHRRRSGN